MILELICDANISKSKQQVSPFREANYLKTILFKYRIEYRNGKLDVYGKWLKCCRIIVLALKKFVPLGKAQGKKYSRWMNKAARAARNRKSKMWIKYRNSTEYRD
jgi:hypothetical protein